MFEFDFRQGQVLRDLVGRGPKRRKRGHADDVRVAAQHQCVGDEGGDPLRCRDFTGLEPGAAGGNRRERDDRGLRREGLPAPDQARGDAWRQSTRFRPVR